MGAAQAHSDSRVADRLWAGEPLARFDKHVGWFRVEGPGGR